MRPRLIKHKIAMAGLAGFIAFLAFSLPPYFREIGSAKWSSVSGVITQSRLRTAYMKKFQGYIPEVEYSYPVGERSFTGTHITFHLDQTLHAERVAEEWLRQYPTGKVVSVYYDPQAPEVAVLQPGIQSEQRWIFYAGLGYLALSTAAFFAVLYDYRRAGALTAKFGAYVRIHKV